MPAWINQLAAQTSDLRHSQVRECPAHLCSVASGVQQAADGSLHPSLYLSVCEVVLAQFLPQQPVFTEHLQIRSYLTKANQVSPITQSLHDVQLQTQWQVCESGSFESRLEERKKNKY